MAWLPRISWRKFMVLLRGLSPQSASAASIQRQKYIGSKRGPRAVEVSTPEQAQTTFVSLFGGGKKRPS